LSNLDLRFGRRQALAVLLSQVLLGGIVTIACLVIGGARAGASALFGTGIGAAATALMAFATLRPGTEASLERVAWGFFSGWLVKVGFTVGLLVVAFRSRRVEAVPLLAAYFVTFLGYWIGAARASRPVTEQQQGRSG
jgi:F0F1-type ATP synthase assembly protein I